MATARKGKPGQRSMRALGARLLRTLGPGLTTSAADDDPSGIATYSQTGAQFGFSLLWNGNHLVDEITFPNWRTRLGAAT